MPFTVEYNPTLELIDLISKGLIRASDLREVTSKAIALGKEKGAKRFFYDASEAELVVSVLDLYDIPDKQYIEENADRFGFLAVVIPTDKPARKAVEFFETVCRNRFWNVRIFSERQEAIDWLMENTS